MADIIIALSLLLPWFHGWDLESRFSSSIEQSISSMTSIDLPDMLSNKDLSWELGVDVS